MLSLAQLSPSLLLILLTFLTLRTLCIFLKILTTDISDIISDIIHIIRNTDITHIILQSLHYTDISYITDIYMYVRWVRQKGQDFQW